MGPTLATGQVSATGLRSMLGQQAPEILPHISGPTGVHFTMILANQLGMLNLRSHF